MIKKVAILCLAALGAALLVLGTAPAASAYPDLTCIASVDRQTLHPGETFTATGSTTLATDASNHPVSDADLHWTFNWNGETQERTGRVVHASFTAPQVSTTRVIPLTVRNTSPAGVCVQHLDIKVLAASVAGPHQGGGLLPSTGGPTFWLLVCAAALLVVGGGTVVRSRRRD